MGRKEGNSVDNQTTENGNGGKQKRGSRKCAEYKMQKTVPQVIGWKAPSGKYLGNFKLTAYCNCAVCCGRWAGGPTASGKMPVQGRTIATGVLPFGTKLNIGGKIYTVEDRGTPYGHIDIYMERHADAAGVRRALRGCISVRRNLIKFADHGGMCIRAVADIRSPCNREIRSGRPGGQAAAYPASAGRAPSARRFRGEYH